MDIFALYRKYVPHRFRHGVRQAYYYVRCKILHLEPSLCFSIDEYKQSHPLEIDTISTFPIQPMAIDDDLYNEDTIDWLRDRLLPNKANISTPPRFFISRKKASELRIFNEDECIAMLKRMDLKLSILKIPQ